VKGWGSFGFLDVVAIVSNKNCSKLRAIIDNRRVVERVMVVVALATFRSKARVSKIFLSIVGGG
jgi:hypothetical protein